MLIPISLISPSFALNHKEIHSKVYHAPGDLCGTSGVVRIELVLASKLAAPQLLVGGKSLPILLFRVPQATM